MPVIIFTDLDGSLLDHEGYSFAEAMPALDMIRRAGIPLIMTTSKTRPEVELLQREIRMREPFIVENGGGIFFPQGYRNLPIENGKPKDGYTVIAIGTTYPRVREFLEKARMRFGMRGFGDMAPEEIAKLTGLPIGKAVLAKEREFTEPFLLKRPDDIAFLSELAAADGFRVTRGGRFHHLMGMEQDKGKAVRIVCDIFRRSSGKELTAIGLGDSENDLAMLEQVDIPVLIPRPGIGYLDVRLPGMIRAKETGARGWNDAVRELLAERVELTRQESPRGREEE